MKPEIIVKTQVFDCGRSVGIAVEYNGQRRVLRVENPFWPEIDREWLKNNSKAA